MLMQTLHSSACAADALSVLVVCLLLLGIICVGCNPLRMHWGFSRRCAVRESCIQELDSSRVCVR